LKQDLSQRGLFERSEFRSKKILIQNATKDWSVETENGTFTRRKE